MELPQAQGEQGQGQEERVRPGPGQVALVDEDGIYLRMVPLESWEQLTEFHLPHIPECDLAPGRYVWIEDPHNRMAGGAFWEIAWLRKLEETVEKAEAMRAGVRPGRLKDARQRREKNLRAVLEKLTSSGVLAIAQGAAGRVQ